MSDQQRRMALAGLRAKPKLGRAEMQMIRRAVTQFRNNSQVFATIQVVSMRSAALAVNLATGLLTAAALGPEGRGIQAALITGPQFLAFIASLGLHISLVYNIKADPERDGEYLASAFVLAIGAGAVAAAVGVAVIPLWLSDYDGHTIVAARWLMAVVPLTVATPLLGATLEAHGRFGTANRSLYISSLCTLIGLCALWCLQALTPARAAACYLLPTVAMLGYYYYHVAPLIRSRLTVGAVAVRRILNYGLRFYGVDFMGGVSGFLDRLVIVVYLAPEAVGIYAVAFSLASMVGVFRAALVTVLFPSVAARPTGEVVDAVAKAVRFMTVANVAAVLFLGTIGPWLITALYGVAFADAAGPFRVLLIENAVAGAARVFYQAFAGTGRPGVVTVFETIGVVACILFMLLLVPSLGMIGAALAVLLASTLRLICTLVGLRTILGVRMPRLILGRSDIQWVMGR